MNKNIDDTEEKAQEANITKELTEDEQDNDGINKITDCRRSKIGKKI